MPSVLDYYKFPFKLHKYQEYDIAHLSQFERCGLFHSVGLGKTVISLGIALSQAIEGEVEKILVIAPPSLITQWVSWLEEVSNLNNNEFVITTYRGTPAKRRKLNLDADFIVMSSGILKKDISILLKTFKDTKLSVIVDEAEIIRRSRTGNFKCVKRIAEGNKLQLLSATPVSSSPMSTYGFIKLITPGIYRNFGAFKRTHVLKEDFWGEPVKFCNLDTMRECLMMQAVQRNAEDHIDLPDIVYKPVLYDLSPKHAALYKKLMDEQLLILEDKVVDATDATRLRHVACQLVTSPSKFSDIEIKSELYSIIDNVIEELGDSKLIIFSNYRLTNEQVFAHVKKLNPVLVYGGIGNKRDERLHKFLTDDSCRCLVASVKSASVGLNLQSVSNVMLFTELPVGGSPEVVQAVGRVFRQGQKNRSVIVMPIAKGTIQERIRRSIIDKEDITMEVYRTPQSVRKAFYGG